MRKFSNRFQIVRKEYEAYIMLADPFACAWVIWVFRAVKMFINSEGIGWVTTKSWSWKYWVAWGSPLKSFSTNATVSLTSKHQGSCSAPPCLGQWSCAKLQEVWPQTIVLFSLSPEVETDCRCEFTTGRIQGWVVAIIGYNRSRYHLKKQVGPWPCMYDMVCSFKPVW
jgi:hypothetical protein